MTDSNDLFARKVVQRLNESLEDLPASTTDRLQQARSEALKRFASTPHTAYNHLFPMDIALRHPWNRWIVLSVMLFIMMALFQYHHLLNVAQDTADIDIAILTNEAPLQSYLDPAFNHAYTHGLLPVSDEVLQDQP